MYLIVNEALYGAEIHFSPNTTWQGVSNVIKAAKSAIENIKANQAAFANMASQPLGTNEFTASADVVNAMSTEFDISNNNYLVTDPRDGTSKFKVDIRNNWKDYQSSSSQMYEIFTQRIVYKEVVFKQMSDLKTAASQASQSKELDSAASSLDSVSSFTSDIDSIKSDIYDYAKAGDDYVPYVQLAFTIFYAVVLSCSAIMVTGTVLFAFCKCNKCRCIGHIGWGIQTLFMILGFLLATVMFPVSVVLIDACDLITLESLSTNSKLIPADVWDQVGICLTGNGDLYKKYKLDETVGFAAKSMSAFDTVDALYDSTKQSLRYNYTDAFVAKADNWRDKDCAAAASSIFSTRNLLQEASGNCKGDLIVWGKDACTSSGSRPILTPDGSTNGGLCVPIRTYTSSNIDTALGTRYDGCSEYKTKVKNLVKYGEDLAAMVDKMKEQTNSFTAAMDSDNNVAKIKPLMAQAADLKAKVGDEITSLTKTLQTGLNCLFLRDTYDRLYVSICGYFTPMLASLALTIVLISLLNIIAIITLTCVNRKFWEEPDKFVSPDANKN